MGDSLFRVTGQFNKMDNALGAYKGLMSLGHALNLMLSYEYEQHLVMFSTMGCELPTCVAELTKQFDSLTDIRVEIEKGL